MKKYELLERTAEIRDKSALKPGCTVDVAFNTPGYDDEPEKLGSFDSLDEAKKSLASFESNIRELSDHIGRRYYLVTEYMVEHGRRKRIRREWRMVRRRRRLVLFAHAGFRR